MFVSDEVRLNVLTSCLREVIFLSKAGSMCESLFLFIVRLGSSAALTYGVFCFGEDHVLLCLCVIYIAPYCCDLYPLSSWAMQRLF